MALKAAVPKDSGLLSVEEWVLEPFAMPSVLLGLADRSGLAFSLLRFLLVASG